MFSLDLLLLIMYLKPLLSDRTLISFNWSLAFVFYLHLQAMAL